jgi:hypothetical protein
MRRKGVVAKKKDVGGGERQRRRKTGEGGQKLFRAERKGEERT